MADADPTDALALPDLAAIRAAQARIAPYVHRTPVLTSRSLDEATGASRRFGGEAQRMRFVADLPDYLGRGGPHLHDLGVANSGKGIALQVDFTMVMAGETIRERMSHSVLSCRLCPPEPLPRV